MRSRLLVGAAAAAAVGVAVPLVSAFPGAKAQPLPDRVLAGSVLRAARTLRPTGVTDPAQAMTVGINLAGRDPAGEAQLAKDLYNPASPAYHRFLTPAQYNHRFGASRDELNAVTDWLRHGGLAVTAVPGASRYVLASGRADTVGRLLHVSFSNYRIGLAGFYANTSAPRVPGDLSVTGIVGLNSFEGPHLNSPPHPAKTAAPSPTTVIGTSTPQVLWSVYDQPKDNFGDQQTMAIFGWGDTNNTAANLKAFEAHFNLPQVPLTVSYLGGANEPISQNSVGEEEWSLDTQSSTGMAPNASGEYLYFGKQGNDTDVIGAYNLWVSDPAGPKQGSSSFSGCEEAPGTDGFAGGPGSPTGADPYLGNPNQDGYERALRQAVIEGRTMFASSGDTGAGCPALAEELNGVTLVPTPMMGYPAVSSYAVAVGGTVLYYNPATDSAGPSRALEYSWPHTGGGPSLFIAAPPWQAGTSAVTPCLTDSHGTFNGVTFCRSTPDIAAQSGDVTGNGMTIYFDNAPQPGGGTSLSSPLWLGMWTRIQAASSRAGGNGFAAPLLYQHAADFFDIGGISTETIPSCNGVTPLNCSHVGYDLTSGLGTPDVAHLARDIDGATAATAPCTAVSGQLPAGCPTLGGGAGQPVPPSHPGATRYYLHSNGCGAANPASYFLDTTTTGKGDNGDGCGVIGGLPVDEVFYQLGVASSHGFATTGGEPTLPLILDGTRAITGTIGTQSWTGGVGGVGTVTADISVTGLDSKGNVVQLGSTQASTSATPTSTAYSIPFSVPATPGNDGAVLTQVSISVALHGLNENAGAAAYKGASLLTIPTHIPG